MLIVIYILLLVTYFYAVYYKSQRSLHMLQQNLYNENNRYIKWILKNAQDFIGMDIIVIGISLIGLIVVYDLTFISNLCMILIALFLVLIGYSTHKNIVKDQNKKKLVVTARIKRLIITLTILHLIPLLVLEWNMSNTTITWMVLLIESIMLYLNRFVVFIAMIINTPIEKLIPMKDNKFASFDQKGNAIVWKVIPKNDNDIINVAKPGKSNS